MIFSSSNRPQYVSVSAAAAAATAGSRHIFSPMQKMPLIAVSLASAGSPRANDEPLTSNPNSNARHAATPSGPQPRTVLFGEHGASSHAGSGGSGVSDPTPSIGPRATAASAPEPEDAEDAEDAARSISDVSSRLNPPYVAARASATDGTKDPGSAACAASKTISLAADAVNRASSLTVSPSRYFTAASMPRRAAARSGPSARRERSPARTASAATAPAPGGNDATSAAVASAAATAPSVSSS